MAEALLEKWQKLARRGRWGIVLVYLIAFWVAYQLIWEAIEPIALPAAVGGADPGVLRLILHVVSALAVAANVTLILSLLSTPSDDRLKIFQAQLEGKEAELRSERAAMETLRAEVVNLAKEREILRLGARILHQDQLSEQEVASLSTFAFSMRPPSFGIPTEAAVEILRSGLEMACADKDFRLKEERLLLEAAREYGVAESTIRPFLQEAVEKFRRRTTEAEP